MAKKNIFKYIIALLLAIISGIVLLDAVYLLPNANVEKNAVDAFSFFYDRSFAEEGYDPGILELRDDFTDLIILTNCFARRPDDPFYKAAMRGTYIGYLVNPDDTIPCYHPFYGMVYYAMFGDGYSYADYSRYWHGYQIILIPLLEKMSYKVLIALNYAVLTGLSFAAALLTAKRFGPLRGLAYAGMTVSLSPAVIPMCLQYSSMAYITLISTIIFCTLKKEENIPLLFMCTGIATAYFDFLTYPALALGVLCTLYILGGIGKKGRLYIIKKLFVCAFLWAFGYGAMLGAKWLAAAVFLGTGEFSDAVTSALFRVNGTGYSLFDILSAVKDMFVETLSIPTLSFTLLLAAAAVICAVKQKSTKTPVKELPLFLIPILITLAWYIVIRNHSIQHQFLAVRNLGAVWFALFALISSIKYKV